MTSSAVTSYRPPLSPATTVTTGTDLTRADYHRWLIEKQKYAQAQEVRARTGPADAAPRHLDSALEAIRPVEPDAIPQRGGLQPFAPGPKETAYFC